MRKFILTLFAAVLMHTAPQPISIPIQNPSFEQGTSGWQFGGHSSVQIAPDGKPAALTGYDWAISQTLQVPQMPAGLYTLNFSIANQFYWYPGAFTASLALSKFYEAPLCALSVHPNGDFTQMSLVCPVRDMYAQSLMMSFSGHSGWATYVRDVSLTFTPVN